MVLGTPDLVWGEVVANGGARIRSAHYLRERHSRAGSLAGEARCDHVPELFEVSFHSMAVNLCDDVLEHEEL
jgi:hypothetical protein